MDNAPPVFSSMNPIIVPNAITIPIARRVAPKPSAMDCTVLRGPNPDAMPIRYATANSTRKAFTFTFPVRYIRIAMLIARTIKTIAPSIDPIHLVNNTLLREGYKYFALEHLDFNR